MVQCKETSGQEYDKKLCAMIPDLLEAEIAEFKKANFFTARCYKVMTAISTGDEEARIGTAILNAGAGPNII